MMSKWTTSFGFGIIRVKVLTAPLAQDVEKDQTVNKYEKGASTVIIDPHIKQDLVENSRFRSDCVEY